MAPPPRGVKGISALDPAVQRMADAAMRANIKACTEATNRLHKIVVFHGARHHLRGRDGKPVALAASKNVKGYNSTQNGVVWTGAVRGIPEGFWRIVEDGSAKHLITQRGSRTTRSGRQVSRKYSKSKTLKLFAEGHGFGDLKPLSAGPGGGFVAAWAMHPGHGRQGRPWENALHQFSPMLGQQMQQEQDKALAQTWVD